MPTINLSPSAASAAPISGSNAPRSPPTVAPSIAEAVQLGAADGVFFSRYFFPKTYRQASPQMHSEIWEQLEGPDSRFIAISVFRDGAKTTLLRTFAAKRLSYGLSRTIIIVGKSESAARRSVRWLMKQVQFNHLWASTFGLSAGDKWTEEECEIKHGLEGHNITVLAFGMTGSIRGVNLDDYRPDLIIVDDPCNTENTATIEQREKTKALLFTDIKMTLAPKSEAPHARMALLQTPLITGDAIDFCLKDAEWQHSIFGVLTKDNLSRWEARYPTAEVLADKEHHIARGMLPQWMREKECTIIASELSPFRVEHLKFYEELPKYGSYILAIDPASSDSKDADDMALAILYFSQADVYLVTYRLYRGYNFDALAADFFGLLRQFAVRLVVIESVAYQRTLIWHMRREMENRRQFVTIQPVDDRRKKSDRIIQALGGLTSMGHFYCMSGHTEFVQQFASYAPVTKPKDDLLDAIAMAITAANPALDGIMLEGEFERIAAEERSIEPLMLGGAP